MDWRTGTTEVRRSRRFVISSIVTVGNYEYGFYWYLYQDGTIETEVKLTGIVHTGAAAPGREPAYGDWSPAGCRRLNHQHFFNVRLDMTVDGERTRSTRCRREAEPPGPENPHGNAFRAVADALLATEPEAQQMIDPLRGALLAGRQPERRNASASRSPTSWCRATNVLPFARRRTRSIVERAGFTTQAPVGDAATTPRERYPAGDYPNQHPGGDGLPAGRAADRPSRRPTSCVWYTFGSHHIARAEDWPVMPVARIGFSLMPDGFFDRNPALDVPPPPGARLSRARPTR